LEDINIPCNKCIYIATCEEELNWHMGEEHNLPSDSYFNTDFACGVCGKCCRSEQDLNYHQTKHESSLKSTDIPSSTKDGQKEELCEFCNEIFETKRMLMQNKKTYHKEKVNVCWNFSSGKCEYGDNLCWFIHHDNSERANFIEIECNICDDTFDNRNNFMQHKKSEHRAQVQMCRNTDKCPYQNCWFRHGPNKCDEQNDQKQDITEQMVNMLENFTQRIMKLENIINKQI
jgi:hypothetical protein